MIGLLVLLVIQQPTRPNLLVDVQLVGVEQTVMEAVLSQDSTLSLPTQELSALLGIVLPAVTWTPLTALRAQFPSLRVTVNLRGLAVYIEDELEVLTATRNVREKQRRQAQRAPVIIPSGPAFALSVDNRGASLVDASYSLQGRVFGQVRSGSLLPRPGSIVQHGATSWALSVIPTPALFLAYSDGDQQRPQATGRLALGPTWVSANWTTTQWSADGLLALGRLSVFVSTRNTYAITLRAPVAVQLGRTGKITTARVSVGPVFPSPFQP